MSRSHPDLRFEYQFHAEGISVVAGLDEAGRGAWAGPVAAGAVILPLERPDLLVVLDGVRDSKQCTPREREEFDALIREVAEAVGVGMADPGEIDCIGIAPACRLAMKRALKALRVRPQGLLIDFVHLRGMKLPQKSFPKGDQRSLSIAAASIVAKVARDHLMVDLDGDYPGYGFAQHKGYGTARHQQAIRGQGPCAIHRRSFSPLRLHLEVKIDEDSSGA